MRTTLTNIHKRMSKKVGAENLVIDRKGVVVTISGKFISRPVVIEGPSKMTDWSIEKWVDTAIDVWTSQHGQAVEYHAENVKKTLLLIKRIWKKMDMPAAIKFRKSIKLGLRSYSSTAQSHDLRKPTDMILCGNVLRELKSFVKKSHKNQNLSIDMIRRLLYNYLLEHMKRKSKTLIGDTNMATKKKVAKKKVAKKKAAKKSVKKVDNVSIDELLKQLAKATDQVDKRKIRAKLRSRGHGGGLGKATSKKATKKVAKKKAKKKAKKSTK